MGMQVVNKTIDLFGQRPIVKAEINEGTITMTDLEFEKSITIEDIRQVLLEAKS